MYIYGYGSPGEEGFLVEGGLSKFVLHLLIWEAVTIVAKGAIQGVIFNGISTKS